MKALSIRQPWAWAILFAGKDIENRNWMHQGADRPTWKGNNPGLNQARVLARARTLIAIHTGQQFDHEGYDFLRLKLGPNIPWRGDFCCGGICGVARLIDVVTEHSSPWFFGPIGLVLRDAAPISFTPCKGALGFFDVPDDLMQEAA